VAAPTRSVKVSDDAESASDEPAVVAATTPTAHRTRSRPVALDACVLGFAVFVVYLATAKFHDPLNNDTRAASVAAWQLAMHGNATLTPFVKEGSWLFHVGNREITNRLPGVIFWATPFYFLLGSHTYPNVYPGALAAAAASAIAVSLVFSMSATLVDRRRALVAAALFAFGTGTWTVSANQLWTHGPAQAAVLLTLLLARRERWLLAGLPAGFAILIRPHLAVVAIVLALVEGVRTRRLRPLLIGVGSLVGLAILLVYNHDLWGRYTVAGGYPNLDPAADHRIGPFLINIAGAFVSPERGMLVLTPALLLLLPGLGAGWKAAPWWVRSGALAGVAYLIAQLWLNRFSGGSGFFSYRVTLEGLSLCVPLLLLAWREWTSVGQLRRSTFAALAVFSVALHAFAAVIDWTPPGEHSPWRTFMPIDLARHVGLIPAVGAALGAVVLAVLAAGYAWQRQPRTPGAALAVSTPAIS
jgi:hypothetical protein